MASESDVILAGLFGRVRSGAKNSVGIPESGAKVLRELLGSDKKVINVSFGQLAVSPKGIGNSVR